MGAPGRVTVATGSIPVRSTNKRGIMNYVEVQEAMHRWRVANHRRSGGLVSDDIVTELRRHAEWAAQGYDVTFSKAADEIERLRAELAAAHLRTRSRGRAIVVLIECRTSDQRLIRKRGVEIERLRAEVTELENRSRKVLGGTDE
jgi:hypothetical protein